MNYSIELIVPPTATEATPAIAKLGTDRGIIQQVTIEGYEGLNGTVKCRLYCSGQQLYPLNLGSYYRLWNNPIKFNDNYPLFPKESVFELKAWSYGSSYNHTIYCYLNILPFSANFRRVIL